MNKRETVVYQICIGDKNYFGSATNFNNRKSRHLSDLKKGKHVNKFLQSAYNKYKEFDMFVIYSCEDREEAFAYEQEVIDLHYGLPDVMNLSSSVVNGMVGRKHSKTTREKMRQSALGKPTSEETKDKISKILKKRLAGIEPKNSKKIYTCPHCNKVGKGVVMFRHHFDNCKENK